METVKQDVATTAEVTTTEEAEASKVFTQDEVNDIVKDRLTRERTKYADYDELKRKADEFDKIEEESKTELEKATEKANALQKELDGLKKAEAVRLIREEVATESGIPVHLLTAETKEDCEAQAKAILTFAKPDNGYPNVKDGGEVTKSPTGSTEEQFAEWWQNQN